MPPFVNHLAPSGTSVSFVSGSGDTQDFSTESTTHAVTYTPSQTGRLFLGLATDNQNSDLGTLPSGWVAHVQDQGAGSSRTVNMHVLSIEVTSGMVGNLQSWDFDIAFAKRATAIMFMLDNVASPPNLEGGTEVDATATDRTTAGGGTLVSSTDGYGHVCFIAANNEAGALSVSSASGFTQVGLVNPATQYQPNAYGGYLTNFGVGTVTFPSFSHSAGVGMSLFGLEVKNP